MKDGKMKERRSADKKKGTASKVMLVCGITTQLPFSGRSIALSEGI